MEKKTLKVAFSTQKGGAGKTTLTVLVASYLHYVKGYNVVVVDCDFPQHSIVEMRERDLKTVMEDQYYKRMAYEQFSALSKKAYVIVESSPENAITDAIEVIDETNPFHGWIISLPPSLPTVWYWKALYNMRLPSMIP